ncbi:MAG: hypothetical protein HC898_05555 [Phycisphaerales bacterium]|nr:hypothetical protein [Phycisphaerales bacterium]
MHPSITHKKDAIAQLCQVHHVARLEVFGSAASTGFDPVSSDIDMLVEFLPLREGQHAEAYFGLLKDLETLFDRPVDLVMTQAIRNRYFLQSVNDSRKMLYAA